MVGFYIFHGTYTFNLGLDPSMRCYMYKDIILEAKVMMS